MFDCVWATAWSRNAHVALRTALDLPTEPWDYLPVQFHKIDAIREYAAGRPWVWIDDSIDDLIPEADPADGILCRVDRRRGIHDIEPDELFLRAMCGDHHTRQS